MKPACPPLSGAWRALCTAALLLVTGCAGYRVTRVYDGVPRNERFISIPAYAAFARAAEWEARGQDNAALRAYRLAADLDPQGMTPRIRVVALLCRSERYGAADEAFADAIEIDASSTELWLERARCLQQQALDPQALDASERAMAAAPLALEALLFNAELLMTQRRANEAFVRLRAHLRQRPHATRVWAALARAAEQLGDKPWQAHARRQLRRLEAKGLTAATSSSSSSAAAADGDSAVAWLRVDDALLGGDIDRAHAQARRARLDPRRLGVRALLLGKPALARRVADLRLAVEPDDVHARLVALLAADMVGEAQHGQVLLSQRPVLSGAFSSEVERLLLAELLWRHVGIDAATQWLSVATTQRPEQTDFDRDTLRRLALRLPPSLKALLSPPAATTERP